MAFSDKSKVFVVVADKTIFKANSAVFDSLKLSFAKASSAIKYASVIKVCAFRNDVVDSNVSIVDIL